MLFTGIAPHRHMSESFFRSGVPSRIHCIPNGMRAFSDEPGLPREPSDSSCPACVAMFCAHPCTARRTLRIRGCVSLTFCVSKVSVCLPWLLLLAIQSACQCSLHLALPWASHCEKCALIATVAPRSDTGLLGLSMSRLPLKSKRTSLIRSCSLQRFCGGVASRDIFPAALPSGVPHVLRYACNIFVLHPKNLPQLPVTP